MRKIYTESNTKKNIYWETNTKRHIWRKIQGITYGVIYKKKEENTQGEKKNTQSDIGEKYTKNILETKYWRTNQVIYFYKNILTTVKVT